jgi:hypothetical protein
MRSVAMNAATITQRYRTTAAVQHLTVSKTGRERHRDVNPVDQLRVHLRGELCQRHGRDADGQPGRRVDAQRLER